MKFRPSFFLPTNHQQTVMNPLLGPLLRFYNRVQLKREVFKFKDQGQTAIDWVDVIPSDLSQQDGAMNKKELRPIVVVVPGLTSNNNEIYMLNLLIEAKKKGFQGVVVNYRGASEMELSSPQLYCAASSNDVREPVEYIRNKYCLNSKGQQIRHLYLVGNSMGAGLVANYIGEENDKCFIRAACCIQPPMKMWITGQAIANNFYGAYDKAIGSNLVRKIQKHADMIHDNYHQNFGVDLKKHLQEINTVTAYDHHITSKVFGYGTRDNYYDKASSIHKVPHIDVPTFVLFAKDDPVIGEGSIDYEICKQNPKILLGVTDHGGHLGYFETFMSTQQWFVKPVFEYLSKIKEMDEDNTPIEAKL
ncbi:ymr210w-like protein [Stylonychia lemnae]|uniref:Ymr210w-like protein n=1 Tax=Stylonychia lemnae TaxID=5949 RepID=A0A078B590_STYLE|nr:ymr210w-like protein [Stylonychia lemnae]|eukprot:CDW88437.1 ymr210w-like protein [Stylonychia lemnae]